MGAPQFTPGPWGCELDGGDWNILYDLNAHQGPRMLGAVFDHAGEFQEADARLIAAAPSLYEALDEARSALGLVEAQHGLNPVLQRAVDRACVALAKARGQQ